MTRKAQGLRWHARKKASIWFHEKRAMNARRQAVASGKTARKARKAARA